MEKSLKEKKNSPSDFFPPLLRGTKDDIRAGSGALRNVHWPSSFISLVRISIPLQSDGSMCTQSVGRTLSRRTHLPVLRSFMDLKDTTLSFTKSFRDVASTLNKFRIPATFGTGQLVRERIGPKNGSWLNPQGVNNFGSYSSRSRSSTSRSSF